MPLIPDFDLTAHNTLALRAVSRFGAYLDSAEAVPAFFAEAEAAGLAPRLLGSGSNVVLSSDFDGVTGLVTMAGRRILAADGNSILLEAEAGEIWHELVAWSVAEGLGGLENLAGIPGTAGAAPVQNIGAYGAELADHFDSLLAYDRQARAMRRLGRADMAFGYRDSLLKQQAGRFVVVSLRLRLPRLWRPNLRFAGLAELADTAGLAPHQVMERVVGLRGSKLPDWRTEPNAGSFFKNPVVPAEAVAPIRAEFPTAPAFEQPGGLIKLSAGWLIEQSGLKGFRLGPVGISDRHALVVVNHGGGSAEDIKTLADHVRAGVAARFGITLQEEPIYL